MTGAPRLGRRRALALGAALVTPAASGCVVVDLLTGSEQDEASFHVSNGTDEPREVTIHFRAASSPESVEETVTIQPREEHYVSIPIDGKTRVVATVSTEEYTAEESATVGGGTGRLFSANVSEDGIDFDKDVV